MSVLLLPSVSLVTVKPVQILVKSSLSTWKRGRKKKKEERRKQANDKMEPNHLEGDMHINRGIMIPGTCFLKVACMPL